jgi:peptidyl-prolyl cis-trans isomerase B (cyclophilin B)
MKKKALIRILTASICMLLMLTVLASCDKSPTGEFDTSKTYYADIVIKDHGTISLVLYDNTAPITVANFVKLANEGFYNGLTFHRIIEGFMMQGGDPKGDGTGNYTDESGKKVTIKGEFNANGVVNNITHTRGVLSMARGNDNNSASCQFFIVHQDSPHLDGKYAAFGLVTKGIEIVDKICTEAKPINGNGLIAKSEQPVIESITIRVEG